MPDLLAPGHPCVQNQRCARWHPTQRFALAPDGSDGNVRGVRTHCFSLIHGLALLTVGSLLVTGAQANEQEEKAIQDPIEVVTIGEPSLRYPLLYVPPAVDALQHAPSRVVALPDDELELYFPLAEDESIWGFGQRFDAFNMRGHTLESWATDGWNRRDTSYFAVPFLISSEGYGLFFNHPGRVQFDIGKTMPDQLIVTIPDKGVEVLAFYGSPSEISQSYTDVVGRPQSAPDWIFRPWMSRNSYFGSDEINSIVDRMGALGMPVGVVVLEAWAEHLHNFAFERRRYPIPITWVRELRDRNVRVVCWITPSVWVNSRSYEEASENGWLVLNEDGSEHVVRWLEGGRKIDFRYPAARDWWRDLQVDLIKAGVSGIKTDGGEHMPDPDFHNQHPFYYQQASLDAFDVAGRPGITFARSGNPLTAQLGAFWAGDQHAEWDSLAAAVRSGLSAAVSGFPLWTHDIGGYSGTPERDLYIRWMQFGALSPIMQFHGITGREPWWYDDKTIEITRFYFTVRDRLQPYLRRWGQDAVQEGIPILRPLVWHYPDDPATHALDDQYLLGPDILIAPMVDDAPSRSVYLPEGAWIDLWTQRRHIGPTTIQATPALHQIPLFVRASAMPVFWNLLEGASQHVEQPLRIEPIGRPNKRGIVPQRIHFAAYGGHHAAAYRLTNQSDEVLPIGIRLAPPADILVSPNQIIRFPLAPGESREVEFDIATAHDALPGTYALTLEVRGAAHDWPGRPVEVTVSPEWYAVGPFSGGVGATPLIEPDNIDRSAPVLSRSGDALEWREVPTDLLQVDGHWDLGRLMGHDGYHHSYLYSRVESPWPRRVRILAGSGDGLTIWLNGRLIWDNPTHRNPEPDMDVIDAVLVAGENHFVVQLHRDLAHHHFFFRLAH